MSRWLISCAAALLVLSGGAISGGAGQGPLSIGDYLDGVRVCSPHFLLSLPVTNTGPRQVTVNRVRTNCSACVSSVLVAGSVIPPGETTELILRGKRKHEHRDELAVTVFVETDSPTSPVQQFDLSIVFAGGYAAEIGWQGDDRRFTYPYETGWNLQPMSVSRGRRLVLELTALEDRVVRTITVDSELLELEQVDVRPDGGSLILRNTAAEPGVYFDYLRLIVNETDLISIPLQVVLYQSVRVLTPSVAFAHAAEGTVLYRDVQIEFDGEGDVWDAFFVEGSEGMGRALSVDGVEKDGPLATIRVRVDTKVMGGRGLKLIAAKLTDKADRQVSLSFCGYVY